MNLLSALSKFNDGINRRLAFLAIFTLLLVIILNIYCLTSYSLLKYTYYNIFFMISLDFLFNYSI